MIKSQKRMLENAVFWLFGHSNIEIYLEFVI
jgi:hypothetical protein